MKTYIKPSTEIDTKAFMLMQNNLGYESVKGSDDEFSNTGSFDEKDELDIDIKQNLWDD